MRVGSAPVNPSSFLIILLQVLSLLSVVPSNTLPFLLCRSRPCTLGGPCGILTGEDLDATHHHPRLVASARLQGARRGRARPPVPQEIRATTPKQRCCAAGPNSKQQLTNNLSIHQQLPTGFPAATGGHRCPPCKSPLHGKAGRGAASGQQQFAHLFFELYNTTNSR